MHRLQVLAPFLMLGFIGVATIGCGDNRWTIDRVRQSSPLRPLVENWQYTEVKPLLVDTVRHDLPKGTHIGTVRSYIQKHFVDDGKLIHEDSMTKKADRQFPLRIRIRIHESGVRFAGSSWQDLIFFFDDAERLDAVNGVYYHTYL